MQVIHLSHMYNNCLLNNFIIYIHAYIYWNLYQVNGDIWHFFKNFKNGIIFGEILYTISSNLTRLLWNNKMYLRLVLWFSYTCLLIHMYKIVFCWVEVIILTCTLYLHLQKCTLYLHVYWLSQFSPNSFEVRLCSYSY